MASFISRPFSTSTRTSHAQRPLSRSGRPRQIPQLVWIAHHVQRPNDVAVDLERRQRTPRVGRAPMSAGRDNPVRRSHEKRARVRHLVAIRRMPAQVGLLHRVLRISHRREHAVGETKQTPPVGLEARGRIRHCACGAHAVRTAPPSSSALGARIDKSLLRSFAGAGAGTASDRTSRGCRPGRRACRLAVAKGVLDGWIDSRRSDGKRQTYHGAASPALHWAAPP